MGLKNNEAICSVTWTPNEGGPPLTITMGVTNSAGGADAATLNTVWQDSIMDDPDGLLHPSRCDSSYTFANFKCLRMVGGVMTSDEIIDTTPGTLDAVSVPVTCCINVKKVTGLAARKYRGRVFVPSAYLTNDNVIESGQLVVDAITDFQTASGVWYNAMAVLGSIQPAILHLKTAEAATPVTGFHIQPTISTLRHRKMKN